MSSGPGGHELRMIEREIDAGDEGRFLVQVAANADVIQGQERSFEWALAATFLTLALALIGSTALAVRFGLRPLRVLREGVAAIRRGEAERIAGEFPAGRRSARDRSQSAASTPTGRSSSGRATQVGNLAHALKTPLSVLMNEADSGSPKPVGEGARTDCDHAPAGHLLSRPRPRGRARQDLRRGTEVKPVVEGLVRTFEKLHAERGADLRRRFATRPEVPRRSPGSERPDRQPARQRGKWAREGVSVRAARARRARDAGPFSSPKSTTMVRASTRAPARRPSSAASGSTNRAPAPASASPLSLSSPRSMAGHSTRRKSARRPAGDPPPAVRLRPRVVLISGVDQCG